MTYSVNTNNDSLCSADSSFLVNNNGHNKDRYIVIFSNMIQFPAKGIFSTNQIRSAGHFYNDKTRKLGCKQILVTTDGREIRMFVSDGLAYLPFVLSSNEYMESCTKVLLIPSGKWKTQDVYDDGQWEDYDKDMSFGANVSVTNFTQSNDFLGSILSSPQHKAPNITFAVDMSFSKVSTDNEFFCDIPELDTCKFD